MRSLGCRTSGWVLVATLALPVVLASGQNPSTAPRRAAPPSFNRGEVQGIFFDNVFSDPGPLVGARPASAHGGHR